MSDIMQIQPFATQLRRILMEYERKGSIFDIHSSLFYTPKADAPFAISDFQRDSCLSANSPRLTVIHKPSKGQLTTCST